MLPQDTYICKILILNNLKSEMFWHMYVCTTLLEVSWKDESDLNFSGWIGFGWIGSQKMTIQLISTGYPLQYRKGLEIQFSRNCKFRKIPNFPIGSGSKWTGGHCRPKKIGRIVSCGSFHSTCPLCPPIFAATVLTTGFSKGAVDDGLTTWSIFASGFTLFSMDK